jgi:hypothetical protein
MPTKTEVRFPTDPHDKELIRRITNRGWDIPWLRRSYEDKVSMTMDVSAVHANGNPLRLEDLLHADDFNFAHDMSGICNCLDRNTGKLTRNFLPRFSRH